MFEIIYGILKQVWIPLLKAKKNINWCQHKTWDHHIELFCSTVKDTNITQLNLCFAFTRSQISCLEYWTSLSFQGPDEEQQQVEPHHTVVFGDGDCVKFENKVRKMSFTSSMLWEFSTSCHLVVIFLPLWGVFSVNCQDAKCWTLDLSSCSVIGRKHLKL